MAPLAYANGLNLPTSRKKNIYVNEAFEKKFLYNLEHMRYRSKSKKMIHDRCLIDPEWQAHQEGQQKTKQLYPKFISKF